MTEQDIKAFATELFVAGEVFNEPVSETRAKAYFNALIDLEITDVRAAVRYLIRESKWFPKPADIRHAIGGSPEAIADNAWQRAITKHTGDITAFLGLDAHDWKQLPLGQKMSLREPFRRAYMRDLVREEIIELTEPGKAKQIQEATP
jgi:hypothetical protein